MPYVGVRTVLSAAGLLRHAERFVSELGVEMINDLVELTQADLIKLGLGDKWPDFKRELDRIVQARHKSRYQLRRRDATDRILALNNNNSAPADGNRGAAPSGEQADADPRIA